MTIQERVEIIMDWTCSPSPVHRQELGNLIASAICDAVAEAALSEREACARRCDRQAELWEHDLCHEAAIAGRELASAIRARPQP